MKGFVGNMHVLGANWNGKGYSISLWGVGICLWRVSKGVQTDSKTSSVFYALYNLHGSLVLRGGLTCGPKVGRKA